MSFFAWFLGFTVCIFSDLDKDTANANMIMKLDKEQC